MNKPTKKSPKEGAASGHAKHKEISPRTRGPGGSNSIILRLKLRRVPGTLGRVMSLISKYGTIGPMYPIGFSNAFVTRDITAYLDATESEEMLVEKIGQLKDVEVVNVSDRTFLMHLRGKIEVVGKKPINNAEDLSMAYTPGVARVCTAIFKDPDKAFSLTVKGNTVAVVTDGTRILGLGNIGPKAGLPVMEGKAMLFKRCADVDAFPICLDTTDTEEFIRTVKIISPVFGAINLEDISSPRCYEIEDRLRKELDIPVMHDDQHATAIVVTAGTINAARVVGKKTTDMKVVCCGSGAAGLASAKMLLQLGVGDLISFNINGALYKGKPGLTPQEQGLAAASNKSCFKGTLKEALKGADMFVGLSAGNVLRPQDLKVMAHDAIVFALANPIPEVDPVMALKYARVVATGRADFPNAINNVLVFPGVFRGALDCRAREITEEMKLEAARGLAAVVTDAELWEEFIIPSIFDPRVVPAIAEAVRSIAVRTGVARRAPLASSV